MSMLSKFVKDIGGTAPLLGRVLGGPAGEAAMTIIGSVLGVPAKEDDIAKALTSDPDAYVKLKQAEMDNKVQLQALVLQSESAYLADVQNARSRELGIVQATKTKDTFLYYLAGFQSFGFFALAALVLALIFFSEIKNVDPNMILLIGTLFGFLGGGYQGVINYFFGSSKSSQDKTDLMHNQVIAAVNGNGKEAK